MAPHRKIEISNATLTGFLRLIKTDEAIEMIKYSFSLKDMKEAIWHIYNQKNLSTNNNLERYMNKKAHLEIPEDN